MQQNTSSIRLNLHEKYNMYELCLSHVSIIEYYYSMTVIHDNLQMMCTNKPISNLYFIISRSINNRDDIYGKFGNCKSSNNEKRFISYDSNNPSYLRVFVPYDETIMQRLGTQHECLDNYINNKVLLKMSSVPKVHFKPSSSSSEKKKTDWFLLPKRQLTI